MEYQVGDRVVHASYGPCDIVQLDEKTVAGQPMLYYVVRIGDMMVWVPKNSNGERNLRPLTPGSEFERMFAILSSPSETLPVDRFERKSLLLDLMRDGTLESKCRVVRDLTRLNQAKKLNDSDVSILERARSFLLIEWRLVLPVATHQAEEQLSKLLETSRQVSPA